ncbi:MAG: exonuclease [Candidatus Altiarchaeales archaeon]|nr:exonuclease [Candidatus Altiarchaeales archaeon]
MLKSTFQHIPGVGVKTERNLWLNGCGCWDEYIEKRDLLALRYCRRIHASVLESKSRLKNLDHGYFRKRLPPSLVWRAYRDFKDHACFIDIETTGLSPENDYVTCACLHSVNETKSYVLGLNLHEIREDLKKYNYIVSFNGARFDLPFLSRQLNLVFSHLHWDLMYCFHELGFFGGLKVIEQRLGVSRESEGVGGLDAVRLWQAYKDKKRVSVAGQTVGGEEALKLLVEYNREDTVNLKDLADYAYDNLRQKTLSFNPTSQ